ncbi:MAG TPA: glycosyltransferase family 4 protein [Bryobacteraceae bacterium]|nr:glycosyltransferase family 4 protein [Bryobacteraceae bacterium]
MKVLFLITRPERGGAQVHVLDLMRGLRDRCDVELAAGDDEDRFLFEEAAKLGISCHVLPSLRQPVGVLRDARALVEISALLRRTRPNLVHAHTSKAGVLGRLAASLHGVPAIFTSHSWSFAEGTSWKWKAVGVPLERAAGRARGLIINVSEANRDLALKYKVAPAARMVTIHNGIPDEPWTYSEPDGDEPAIVMVARFAPQKNQAMLLDAIAQIRRPFRVVFVGAGPTLAAVDEKARTMGLTGRVTFAGNRSDVPAILRQSAIFALPTNWEGFPISILEAMRAGLPIVASDVGGVREAVVDGDNGFLVRRDDTSQLRRSLQTLLDDPEKRRRMALRSRQLFEQRFTAQHMLEKTFGLYRMAVPDAHAEYDLAALRTGGQA